MNLRKLHNTPGTILHHFCTHERNSFVTCWLMKGLGYVAGICWKELEWDQWRWVLMMVSSREWFSIFLSLGPIFQLNLFGDILLPGTRHHVIEWYWCTAFYFLFVFLSLNESEHTQKHNEGVIFMSDVWQQDMIIWYYIHNIHDNMTPSWIWLKFAYISAQQIRYSFPIHPHSRQLKKVKRVGLAARRVVSTVDMLILWLCCDQNHKRFRFRLHPMFCIFFRHVLSFFGFQQTVSHWCFFVNSYPTWN